MRRRTAATTALAISMALASVAVIPASASPGDPGNGPTDSPSLSADGRWLAFISGATDLVGDPTQDANGVTDAFVVDMQTGTVELVSEPAGGGEADGATTEVDISRDGRYVAFVSEATNLIPTDANGADSDVFVVDRLSGAVTLASRRGSTGAQGDAPSWNVSITNDGTKVSYTSYAENLVAGDTNDQPDAFVRDLAAATTTRVSTSSNGKQTGQGTLRAAISGNGAIVAFQNNGSLVGGDTNGKRDVFVKNLATGKTEIVSQTNREGQSNGHSTFYDLSVNGRTVVFTSDATNLAGADGNGVIDTFVRDRAGGTTVRVSRNGTTEANAASYGASVSPDGAFVAFTTTATNLGTTDDGNGSAADVFEFEVATKTLRRVAVDETGGWADGANFDPVYGTSMVIAFATFATDLDPGDTTSTSDVYTRAYSADRDARGTITCRSAAAG